MLSKYTVTEDLDLPAILSTEVAIYNELTIINNTLSDVSVIYPTGECKTLPSCPIYIAQALRKEVVIQERYGLDNIRNPRDGTPIKLKGRRIVIKQEELEKQPVFVKELNIVLTPSYNANYVKHPCESLDYTEAAIKAVASFTKAVDESISITITANDPTNSVDTLYTAVCGTLFTIPVYHAYESSIIPQIIYTVKVADSVTVITIDLRDWLNSTSPILIPEQSILPFITRDKIIAEETLASYRTYSADEIDERLKKLASEYEAERAAVKETHEIELISLNNQLKRFKDLIAEKDHEITMLTAKYDSLSGSVMYGDLSQERLLKKETLINANAISENNVAIATTKASTTRIESDSKMWQIIAVAAVPILAAVAGILIKKWNSD